MSKSAPATNYSRATDAVRPITPAIGAEIHGVRLSGDLPAATCLQKCRQRNNPAPDHRSCWRREEQRSTAYPAKAMWTLIVSAHF
jgi:hypothetical protein